MQNDYSGLAPEWGQPSPEFTARRAAAYQAYYEHMPIRHQVGEEAGAGAAHLSPAAVTASWPTSRMLDDRQYRTDNPCGDGEALRCEEALTGNYTMLGREQEAAGSRAVSASARRRWNFIGQQLLIAELEHTLPGYPDEWYWNDAWDGYPLARQRMLEGVVQQRPLATRCS